MKRKYVAIIILCSLFLGACGQKEETGSILELEESALDAEQKTVVKRGDIESYIVLDGYVAPEVSQLKFETTGKFDDYKVQIGDEVTKGQTLAVMNDAQIKEQIKELNIQLTKLQGDYEFEIAYKDKTIAAYKAEMEGYYEKIEDEEHPLTREEYSEACLELGKRDVVVKREELLKKQLTQTFELDSSFLQAQLNELNVKLGKMSIKSPCEGTVIALQDMSGQEDVLPDYYYVAIAKKDTYNVCCEYMAPAFLESVKYMCGLRNGKEYEIETMDVDKKVYREMKNSGEKMYSHFLIKLPDADTNYGDFMVVKLVTKKAENVLFIPQLAISSDQSGKFVYCQTEKGREKVYVTLGLSDTINVEVKEGLKEGDVVYVQK